ncbi:MULTISPECIES: hypothetical protein [unclassified Haloarcula]|uniref:hypothetical protein n=1 Tax=unclassified Haloarcula TaxID=2624677 RepID=UPI0011C3D438|nr:MULTISPECIES: hypothetical protein [unclassified Haloarcula]
MLLPSSAVGANGTPTDVTLAIARSRCTRRVATARPSGTTTGWHTRHPAYPRRPPACVGATGCADRVVSARAGWRAYVTDDTSVGTMDGELTSANH